MHCVTFRWILLCLLSDDLCLNDMKQTEHWCGLFVLWTSECFWSVALSLNSFPQRSQICSFTPVCLFLMWCFIVYFCLNLFKHQGHSCGFSFRWISTGKRVAIRTSKFVRSSHLQWLFNAIFWRKHRPQSSHLNCFVFSCTFKCNE